MIYCLYTLVDITATYRYKSRTDIERLQQQNFDTVIQTIGLTANVSYSNPPAIIAADIFGAPNERCWYFEWSAEREDVFEHNGDKIARLKETFEFVPFIPNLTETVKFDRQYFSLGRNIVFDYKQ